MVAIIFSPTVLAYNLVSKIDCIFQEIANHIEECKIHYSIWKIIPKKIFRKLKSYLIEAYKYLAYKKRRTY